MPALSWSASPRSVRRPHLPVARRGGAPAVDVGKRAQRRHGTRGFRLRADARGRDGGVRQKLLSCSSAAPRWRASDLGEGSDRDERRGNSPLGSRVPIDRAARRAAPVLRRTRYVFGSDSGATVEMLHVAETVGRSLDVQVTAVDVCDGVDEGAITTFQPVGWRPDRPCRIATSHQVVHPIMLLAAHHRLPAVYPYSRGRADVLRTPSDRTMARGGNLRRSHARTRWGAKEHRVPNDQSAPIDRVRLRLFGQK
jgi:hypothetical protein